METVEVPITREILDILGSSKVPEDVYCVVIDNIRYVNTLYQEDEKRRIEMNELQLIKSANFGDTKADIYSNEKDMFMTANQLGECLGYSDPIRNINKLVSRNERLKNKKFSTVVKLTTVDGKQRNVRIFNEDGIYEVTFLSKTEKAEEFRDWVRTVLKSLRKGETRIVSMTDYQKMMAKTREENAKIRKAQILTKLSEQYDGTFKQVLQSYATKELTGEFLLPLPETGKKTYSATDLGDMLGVSANKIGKLANANNLKTKEFGSWFNDKAPGHNREVTVFRYYDNVIPVLEKLLESQAG